MNCNLRLRRGVARAWIVGGVAVGMILSVVEIGPRTAGAAGGEPVKPDKVQGDERSKRRLDLMNSKIQGFQLTAPSGLSESALKFGKKPLLRFNDETRGFLDGGLWRLGESGRPTALVTIELYRYKEQQAQLTFEFCSLSPKAFSMTAPGAVWNSPGTDLKMSALADAPAPADSPTARLLQMRQIARRFAVHEQIEKDQVECRFMPTPIDRYADADQGIVDGAMFVFANGTNPELGMLLESKDKEWAYGVYRMSSAALTIDLDGKTVLEIPAFTNYARNAPYTATRYVIDLPD